MRALTILPFGRPGQTLVGVGVAILALGDTVAGLVVIGVGCAYAVPEIRSRWRRARGA